MTRLPSPTATALRRGRRRRFVACDSPSTCTRTGRSITPGRLSDGVECRTSVSGGAGLGGCSAGTSRLFPRIGRTGDGRDVYRTGAAPGVPCLCRAGLARRTDRHGDGRGGDVPARSPALWRAERSLFPKRHVAGGAQRQPHPRICASRYSANGCCAAVWRA